MSALDDVARARAERDHAYRAADRRFRAAIIRAREDGATLQRIGDAAGVTRQRVWQIVKGRP